MSNPGIFQSSFPAERMRGAKLVEDFRDALTVARNGWTAVGSPTYAKGGGVILNGATQYLTRTLAGATVSASLTFHAEIYPTFAADDGAEHYVFDCATAPGGRSSINKTAANALIVLVGASTTVLSAALAEYQAYWVVGGRNIISASCISGTNTLWLNGVQIATSATAWTPHNSPTLYVGANRAAASFFPGRIGRLYIGHHTSTLAEHQAYYNQTMFNWRNRATVDLQMRMQDYDPTNVRTLDSSGHANHFTLGNGVTATTFPTQGNGRMTFDGGDYLARANVAQPAGAFSVVATVENRTGATIAYYGDHHVGDAYNWILLITNTGVYRFYVGGGSANNAGYFTGSIDSLYHTFVGTWDGTNTNIFVDGVRGTQAPIPLPPSGGALAMRLGQSNAAANIFIGTMYDFKYFDGIALNQVQALDYHHQMMASIGAEV